MEQNSGPSKEPGSAGHKMSKECFDAFFPHPYCTRSTYTLKQFTAALLNESEEDVAAMEEEDCIQEAKWHRKNFPERYDPSLDLNAPIPRKYPKKQAKKRWTVGGVCISDSDTSPDSSPEKLTPEEIRAKEQKEHELIYRTYEKFKGKGVQ